jgi:hypothetical protein
MIKKTLIALAILIVACQPDESIVQPAGKSIPVIATSEEYLALSETLLNASDEELRHFERKKGFTSYKSILNKALKESMRVETPEELTALLVKYKNIIMLKDSMIIPVIDFPLFQRLANEDGLFETYGHLHKVTSDYLYTVKTEDKHLLNEEITYDQAIVNDKIIVDRYTTAESQVVGLLDCHTKYYKEYNHDGGACSNDRKISITVLSYKNCAIIIGGSTYCQNFVKITLEPWKRTWYCSKYVNYSSTLNWRNVSFTLGGSDFTMPDQSIESWNMENTVLTQTHPKKVPYSFNPTPFDHVHVEATSRGMDGEWGVLDEYCSIVL